MNFEQARQYAETRLGQELSPDLLYHGIGHTRDDVVPAVTTLATMEGVRQAELQLLLTAAWFHDIGYIEQALQHELIGARIAEEALPGFGYSREDVEVVRQAILATVLPQSPKNKLDEILADADLDVLGRTDFIPRNHDLRRELVNLGREFTDEQWYASQLKFIEEHTYFTTSARALRDAQKMINIAWLKRMLEELTL